MTISVGPNAGRAGAVDDDRATQDELRVGAVTFLACRRGRHFEFVFGRETRGGVTGTSWIQSSPRPAYEESLGVACVVHLHATKARIMP